MNRWFLALILLSLALGSCLPPQSEPSPQLDVRPSSTATVTEVPQADAEETSSEVEHEDKTNPAASPTLAPTDLPMLTLEPSITPAPMIAYLPPVLNSSELVTITQITMITTENGWGIGHQNDSGDRILYTQDGGFTWDERTPPILEIPDQNPTEFKTWAYFYDEQTAWAISLSQNMQQPTIDTPIIWRTSDGGLTWDASDDLPITQAESYFIPENFSFVSPLQGWLLVHVDAGMSHDYSNLYVTSDGGITWQKLIDPYGEGLQSLHNTGLAFADTQYGWVSKDNLAVMAKTFLEQSRDGGQKWESVFLPAPAEFNWDDEVSQCATSQPNFLVSGTGIVLVNCQTFDGRSYTFTYQTPDQGQTWQSTQLPSPVQSLEFINNQTGWAFGRDLYQSSDGGLSWVKIKTVNWDGQFSFVDEYSGWAVATNNGAIALVYTQDGAKTWQQINPIIR